MGAEVKVRLGGSEVDKARVTETPLTRREKVRSEGSEVRISPSVRRTDPHLLPTLTTIPSQLGAHRPREP